MGLLLFTRPLTAVGIGLPFAIWALVDCIRDHRRLRQYALMALAFLPFVGLLLWYNDLTTGNPFKSAYELWWPFDRVGFGDGIGITGHHSVGQGLHFAHLNISQLENYLFGWPLRLSLLPALLAVGVAAARLAWLGIRWARAQRDGVAPPAADSIVTGAAGWDLALAAMAVSLATVHVAYPTPGIMYGPRYYFEAMPAFMLLSARGILLMAEALGALGRRVSGGDRRVARAAAALAFVTVAALSLFGAAHFTRDQFRLFRGWNNVNDSGLRSVQATQPHNAVVFVTITTWDQYAPYFMQNTPALDTDVVYAIDRGDELNRLLADEFPGRTLWRFTDGSLVQIAGP
jgi:hypothetical protein